MKRVLQTLKIPDGDKRGPIGGWCPGEYLCHCIKCGDFFIGDKRAWQCADCAYDEAFSIPPDSELS